MEWSGVEKWSGVDPVEQAHHACMQAGRQASRQTHTSTGTSGKPNDVVASRFRLEGRRRGPCKLKLGCFLGVKVGWQILEINGRRIDLIDDFADLSTSAFGHRNFRE